MSTDLKNVVIVGASTAGATLARALENKLPSTHRIVLIDAQDFAFWPISGLRAAVVPGWEDKSFKSLAGFFPASSRHVLLSKTKVVELGKGFLKVDVANSELGFSEEIAFDIAVLALGSTYAFPMRPLGTSLVDVKQPFIDAQNALKSGQDNIVIVGGGTVGIEYAGEIIAAYPKKSVTLISGSDRLLNDEWPIKLSNKLEVELTSRKVKVVYGERVEKDLLSAGRGTVVLKDGTSIDADLIVNATGTTPNTKIISSTDSGALNASGFVTVEKTLRITSTNPSSPLVTSTYFAIGDIANNTGGPTAIKAGNDAATTATNILATISSKSLSEVPAPLHGLVVPVGPSGGGSALPYVGVVGGILTGLAKGKGLMIGNFAKLYAA
ncbi:hypothetical protein BDY24DRAFT_398479 [Mrakia frigida]|uniref:NAD(P)/FAD-dependent oxidoreductase n=1 Tax=Mrakia frigida TaxID=29902 RepID=UPI003FCC188B